MINIITGLGRCGTSMVMQMMDAAGEQVTGQPNWYEPRQTHPKHFNPRWLLRQDDKFIKFIHPIQFDFPSAEYKILWLTRNPLQQFFSICKLQNAVKGQLEDMRLRPTVPYGGTIQAGVESILRNTKEALEYLESVGPVHVMSFETILAQPIEAAERIALHFKLTTDIDKMAGVVRNREAKTAKEMEA